MVTEPTSFPNEPREELKTFAPPGHEPPRKIHAYGVRDPGRGIGGMLSNALVAFLMGGAGAGVYLNFVHPQLTARQATAEEPARAAVGREAGAAPGRLDELTTRLDQLQSRVEQLPQASAIPDLEPINQRITTVDELARKLANQQTRVAALPEKFDENVRKVTSMMADVEGLRSEVANLSTELHAAKSATPARPASEMPKEVQTTATQNAATDRIGAESYARGIEQFQSKHYKDARETFDQLSQLRPNDARVWYYAALARGFATGDWKNDTEKLVKQGVDHERAGKPEKAKIDEAFAGLTTATGKDWLTFYRRSASPNTSAAR